MHYISKVKSWIKRARHRGLIYSPECEFKVGDADEIAEACFMEYWMSEEGSHEKPID